MDFSLPPALDDIRLRTRAFVADHILSLEQDPGAHDEHENIAELALARVRALAKAQGLWSPQVPVALGGMGLPMVGQAVMYEEANRSIFGPVCFNCAAPDDGNMRLLATVGTEVQKARWLAPIVSGEVRSAFAMTEPAPGGGSDPAMIRTKAERIAGGWRIAYRGDLVIRHKVAPEQRQVWSDRRWFHFVRNRLYIERKHVACWPALLPRIGGYLLKGRRHGLLRPTLEAILAAARMAVSPMPLPPVALAYLARHDLAHRGSWRDRWRAEVLARLAPQPSRSRSSSGMIAGQSSR